MQLHDIDTTSYTLQCEHTADMQPKARSDSSQPPLATPNWTSI